MREGIAKKTSPIFRGINKVILCSRCGERINIGERYLTVGRRNVRNSWIKSNKKIVRLKRKIYCSDCMDKIYCDSDVNEND